MISIRKKKKGGPAPKTSSKSGFFRFSSRVEHGLFLMTRLALHNGKKPASLKKIADDNTMSFFFLQKVACSLRQKGLIIADRGKFGGYLLAKKNNKITIREILEALEGPLSLIRCLDDSNGAELCGREDHCFIRGGLTFVNELILKTLSSTTLSDLIKAS